MIKFSNVEVVFAEVPDEVSLAINITNCPHKCKDCHSPWLQEDVGQPLTEDLLNSLLAEYDYITCVLFMGGDQSPEQIQPRAALPIPSPPRSLDRNYSPPSADRSHPS